MTALLEIENWTGRIDDVYASPVQPDDEDAMSNHAFRSPESLWKAFGEMCKAMGSTRSVELRKFMTAAVATWRKEQRRIERD